MLEPYKFSIVIPTRDRPQFVREALKNISQMTYGNYEVIVSDNCSSDSFSCHNVVLDSGICNIKYVRPDKQLSMIDNWNFPVEHISGDYILYLTDKMFLLPHTLKNAAVAAEKTGADIINWPDDIYTPTSWKSYFGEGFYTVTNDSHVTSGDFREFDALEALNFKTTAVTRRSDQTRDQYAEGKIIFGTYKKDLVDSIIRKYGKLFHPVSPDYTSMVLALSEATSCVMLSKSGIVHINTDISNGGRGLLDDAFALSYYNLLEEKELVLSNMLIPGLYCSANNGITHDYLYLKKKFNLRHEFDKVMWLLYTYEDVHLNGRQWSSDDVKQDQLSRLDNFIKNLNDTERTRFNLEKENREIQLSNIAQLASRQYETSSLSLFQSAKRWFIRLFPDSFWLFYQKIRHLRPDGYFDSLDDAIQCHSKAI